MDFKTHLEFAWHQTLKNLVPLILMSLVMVIITIAAVLMVMPLIFLTMALAMVWTGLILTLMMVMMAGYFQAILEMMRHDRQPRIQDLFSQKKLFLPLFLFSIIAAVAIAVGLKLLILPGLAIICVLAFGCLYMVPLMVDRRLGIAKAIQVSWHMATQDNVADQVVVVILFLGFIAIGSLVGIGTLLTQPFASVFLISIYLEKIKKLDESVDQPQPLNSDL